MGRRFCTLLTVATLLMSMLILSLDVKPARAQLFPTIYIRADGSIDPPTAPIITDDNMTYRLTANIETDYTIHDLDGIVVERDNIVLDGSGFNLSTLDKGEGSSGIHVYGRNNVTIKNIRIQGIPRVQGYCIGITLSGSNSCIVKNATLNAYSAVYMLGCMNCHAFNCKMEDWLTMWDSIGNFIHDNSLGYMVRMVNSSKNAFFRNKASQGVWLISSSNNSLSFNDIQPSPPFGFKLDIASNNNWIFGNRIAKKWLAFEISGDSSGNRIYQNNLINNTMQVSISNSTETWDNGYPSGGNYWSDYNGTDSNYDGIGDTPYVIDSSNMDNYPLVNLIALLVGDVNGDGFVGIDDIFIIALHFGAETGQPNYLRTCDLNLDNFIGIDDIFTAASHFGEEFP